MFQDAVLGEEHTQNLFVLFLITVFMLSRFSHVQLFATLWTVACQAPLSIGFSRQEYWSGLPWHPPGDFPKPRIEPMSPASPALRMDVLPTEPPGKSYMGKLNFCGLDHRSWQAHDP